MPKPLKRREFIRRLKRHGFEGPYSGSKHQFMVKGALKLRIPNPHERGISGPLIAEVIRQGGIHPDDWE